MKIKQLLYTLSLLLFLYFSTQAATPPIAIYHAFDTTFTDIIFNLPHIAWTGYTHIQVSPIQKSHGSGTENDLWWVAYQPIEYAIGGKYGSEEDFKKLIKKAKEYKIGIIVDVVFNHVGSLDGVSKEEWQKATNQKIADNPALYNEYIGRLVKRHKPLQGFTSDDFNPFDQAWCGDCPSLNLSSSRVQKAQKQYLLDLIKLGVAGFRFDMIKDFLPKAWPHFTKFLNKYKVWFYGEYVNTESADSYKAYTDHGPTTDFRFLKSLYDAFSPGGKLSSLRIPATNNDPKSITFAENHDTLMAHTSGGGISFFIENNDDRRLAMLFTIARHDGVPLILNEDHENFFKDIVWALRFRHHLIHLIMLKQLRGLSTVLIWSKISSF